jgi:hypothetical protein
MLVEREQLLAALRLPVTTEVDFEPLGGTRFAPERVSLCVPGAAERLVLLRAFAERDEAENHIAVLGALQLRGFRQAPKLLGVVGAVAIEAWVDGFTALAVVPAPGACEAAVTALADLHALPIREGMRWGAAPADLFSADEVPLHRLGFAAYERELARRPLSAGLDAVLETPFGFVHRNATAANVLLDGARATIVDYSTAGYGAQFMDVAAFLLTSGLDAAARRALAAHYARVRGLPLADAVDGVDVAGILWGIGHLLVLPRRLIETHGDDTASEAISLAAGRVDRGMRLPAGEHPAAAAIRAALWPE